MVLYDRLSRLFAELQSRGRRLCPLCFQAARPSPRYRRAVSNAIDRGARSRRDACAPSARDALGGSGFATGGELQLLRQGPDVRLPDHGEMVAGYREDLDLGR